MDARWRRMLPAVVLGALVAPVHALANGQNPGVAASAMPLRAICRAGGESVLIEQPTVDGAETLRLRRGLARLEVPLATVKRLRLGSDRLKEGTTAEAVVEVADRSETGLIEVRRDGRGVTLAGRDERGIRTEVDLADCEEVEFGHGLSGGGGDSGGSGRPTPRS